MARMVRIQKRSPWGSCLGHLVVVVCTLWSHFEDEHSKVSFIELNREVFDTEKAFGSEWRAGFKALIPNLNNVPFKISM